MTPRKRSRLKNLSFDEVSFCKRGMNQRADVLIFKSQQEDVSMPVEKDGPVARFKKSLGAMLRIASTGKDEEGNVLKSDEEQDAAISKHLDEVEKALESDVEEPVNKARPGKGKKGSAGEILSRDDEDPAEEDAEMAKAYLDSAVEAAVEERTALIKAQTDEQLDVMRKALEAVTSATELATLRKSVEAVTGNVPVDLDAVTKALQAMPEAGRAAMLKAFASANTVASMGLMTRPIGHTIVKADSPEGKLDTMAKAYATANKVTFAKAYTEVVKTPEGRAEYAALMQDQGFSHA